MNTIKLKVKIRKLIKKGKVEYIENWDANMIKYDKNKHLFMVLTDDINYCKTFFNADTLECIGWESL
jgi:uncharacterized protein YacL